MVPPREGESALQAAPPHRILCPQCGLDILDCSQSPLVLPSCVPQVQIKSSLPPLPGGIWGLCEGQVLIETDHVLAVSDGVSCLQCGGLGPCLSVAAAVAGRDGAGLPSAEAAEPRQWGTSSPRLPVPPGSLCLQAWPSQPLSRGSGPQTGGLLRQCCPWGSGPPVSTVPGWALWAPGFLFSRLYLTAPLVGGRLQAVPWGLARQGRACGGGARWSAQGSCLSSDPICSWPSVPWPAPRAKRAQRALVLPPTICGAPGGLAGTQPYSRFGPQALHAGQTLEPGVRPEAFLCCAPSAQPQSQGHHAVQPHGGLGLQTDRSPRYRTGHTGWLPPPGTDDPRATESSGH